LVRAAKPPSGSRGRRISNLGKQYEPLGLGQNIIPQYRADAVEPALRCDDALRHAGRSPAVGWKKRCRMHGGAPGSGAPPGNKNALKHGLYTREAIEERRHWRALMRQSRRLIEQIK
jgi:hypothetical protein